MTHHKMTASRFAIYFAPAAGSRLGKFGSTVIGYDCHSHRRVERLPFAHISPEEAALYTSGAASYGFHATLKAPFHLDAAHSITALREAVDRFAERQPAVEAGKLQVESLGNFVALRPGGPTQELDKLAADCVRSFDPFRASLSENDRLRRNKPGLTPRQTEMLDRWGYPYVFDDFRFHLTLAGPLPEGRLGTWLDVLSTAFLPVSEDCITINTISLVMQDEPETPFHVVHSATLNG